MQEGWRVVPFAQMGAGLVITDVDRRLQGQDFNFNLEIGAGLRWFFRPDWSLDLEYRFQHISNAGMNHKNIGVNAEGFVAGVSWFF